MKYLKTFENKTTQYAKDYNERFAPNFTNLHYDLMTLSYQNIPYEIYFYNDTEYKAGPCIKIYSDSYIDKEKKEILKKMKFNVFPEDYRYEFTWDWKKIKEEDIEAALASSKYNL